jgi:hypothetical protein
VPKEAVPAWVHEAILQYVIEIFNKRDEGKKSASSGAPTKGVFQGAMDVLSPHMRKLGFSYRPIR